MNPEQAAFLRDQHMGSFAHESGVTRKVIAAVPEDKSSYTPDPKSMTAKALAWHLVSAEEFFLRSVLAGQFTPGGGDGGKMPDGVSTIADILAYGERTVPPLAEEVKKLSGDKLAQSVDFFGMMQSPGVWYLDLMVKHEVHHRGQLSAYLRPMGAKVPGIYGPSADEPIQR